MRGPVGAVLLVVAAVQAVVGLLFVFDVSWAVGLLPFEGRTPLSNIFVGSIFLAAAASTAWCITEGSGRAIAGIALDYVAIFIPFTIVSFAAAAGASSDRAPALAAFGVSTAVGALVGVWLLRWAMARPWTDPRSLPSPIRVAFVVFVLALVPVGLVLVLQVPNILPWPVTPELSTLFGLMFLGAAAYFSFGLLDPRWENAGGQLAGFLAYDLVLVVPFLVRLPTIEPSLLPNLVVYTVVVIGSGILALFYLAIHAPTRVRIRTAETPPQPADRPMPPEAA
ncbi:MAG: hypothetical protein WEE50_08635 [Chloroflexota bacterium]